MSTQPFTFEQLQKTIEALTPTLYYVVTDFFERGRVMICAEGEWTPEFVIVHKDDFDIFKNECESAHIRLVRLKDESAESTMERIGRRLTRYEPDIRPITLQPKETDV